MTQEEMDQLFKKAHDEMDHSIEHLINELGKIRTGKASPAMVSSILVPYYGSPTMLNQVANVSTSDARTITIQPWEKNMIGPIEKAIFEANLGITPMNNGEHIILTIPLSPKNGGRTSSSRPSTWEKRPRSAFAPSATS